MIYPLGALWSHSCLSLASWGKCQKLNLPEEWQLICDMATVIRESRQPLPRPGLWPIRGLARRSANMVRGLLTLLTNELLVECLVLQRPLSRGTGITIRWLLARDNGERLARYVAGLNREKGGWREEVAADGGGGDGLDECRTQATANAETPLPPEWGVPDSRRLKPLPSVKQMAVEVGLTRDYDIVYWIESAFIHASPLAIVESHPSDVHHPAYVRSSPARRTVNCPDSWHWSTHQS